jgi:phage shock protein A
MIRRLKRLFRAIFGSWLETIEDPELILKQNIRDLNDQVPRMNENIAIVRANAILLENQKQKLESKIPDFENKIRAALRAGRRDIALNYATTLEEINENLKMNQDQLEVAREAHSRALKVKKAFMLEKERKTREAVAAIKAAERARWQRQMAEALESFEMSDAGRTHDEMIERIEEKAARDRAYLEVALQTGNAQSFHLDEEVRKIEANETVRRFENELGILPPPRLSLGASEPESPSPPSQTESSPE